MLLDDSCSDASDLFNECDSPSRRLTESARRPEPVARQRLTRARAARDGVPSHMSKRRIWSGLAVVGVVVLAAVGAGKVFGVGPLAPVVPAAMVTDPKEMIARSLQATIDASAVHLDWSVSGTIPGSLVARPEPSITLDGTTLAVDIRPKDGKTKAHLASEALGVDLDTVTIWDGVWYRTAEDQPWARASLGDKSASAGVDINPLTLVDRLRSYLATPGVSPTTHDVACASASGRCHEITIDAGSDPAMILALMLPHGQSDNLPPIDVVITLQTDVETLRPVHLVADAKSADGTIDIHTVIDAGHWDEDLVIEEPHDRPAPS
jgi:hypothetical protein